MKKAFLILAVIQISSGLAFSGKGQYAKGECVDNASCRALEPSIGSGQKDGGWVPDKVNKCGTRCDLAEGTPAVGCGGPLGVVESPAVKQ